MFRRPKVKYLQKLEEFCKSRPSSREWLDNMSVCYLIYEDQLDAFILCLDIRSLYTCVYTE